MIHNDADWDAAIDRAIAHGCRPEDSCWSTCVDRAYDELKGMR